jgi:hypothetical protein
MGNIILLGDSIFDNASYVGGGPDVVKQLQELLPPGWKATLKARDGSTIRNVENQLIALPEDASHLVISVGGNDALGNIDILNVKVESSAETLQMLANASGQFQYDYQKMLRSVLKHKLPSILCTIYYPNFPDSALQQNSVTALSIFNDCIIREAFAAGLPLLDLRLICNEKTDYANPIEPSVRGGKKITAAIVKAIKNHDFNRHITEVYI